MLMFVDVCFPENNEGEFIRVAEKLGIYGLLFLYNKKSKPKEIKRSNVFVGRYLQKQGVFDCYKILNGKKILVHTMDKKITQVHVKSVSCPVVLSLDWLINKKKFEYIGSCSLFMALCKKEKVICPIACGASSPCGLRSKKEIFSILKKITPDENQKKRAMVSLYKYIAPESSASFL